MSEFSIISPKTRRWKFFAWQNIQPRSITMLPTQLSKTQIDAGNTFETNERQGQQTKQAMGNVESVSLKIKRCRFFYNWLEIFFGKKNCSTLPY